MEFPPSEKICHSNDNFVDNEEVITKGNVGGHNTLP